MKISRHHYTIDQNIDIKNICSQLGQGATSLFKTHRQQLPTSQLTSLCDRIYKSPRNNTQKKKTKLKELIKQQKIKNIICNFQKKIRRNVSSTDPIQIQPILKDKTTNWLDCNGIVISQQMQRFIVGFSLFEYIVLFFVYSLSFVFSEVSDSVTLKKIELILLFLLIGEIGLNLTVVKNVQGKKLQKLKQIGTYYLTNNFFVDFICVIVLVLISLFEIKYATYFRLLVMCKCFDYHEKVHKFQVIFNKSFQSEQYWGLIKVILLNFLFAHGLCICLLAMTFLNQNENWITKKQIYNHPWYQQYMWAYYWGTNIMLTVGFGDLSATNCQEAFVLTLIESVSCIALAYNINCVGNIINNIRSQQIEKSKNYKIMRQLARKNDVPQNLQARINHFIEESINIKKKFNFDGENQFICKLPKDLKAQFLKESNKKIFQKLPFFKSLTEKSLMELACQLEMTISHPQQVINRQCDNLSIMILKQGRIGLCANKKDCQYNGITLQTLSVEENQNPMILSLSFITKETPNHLFKSQIYSIIYFLNYQATLQILKKTNLDYEHFCMLRDKSKHIIDQFQIVPCNHCKEQKHSKFKCPKIHYMPFQQIIKLKHINNVKKMKSDRMSMKRKLIQFNSLKKYKNLQNLGSFSTLQKGASIRTILEKIQQYKTSHNLTSEKFCEIKSQVSEAKAYFKEISQMFKKQILNIFQQNKKDIIIENIFWDLECDEATNYKFYFKSQNPNNLSLKKKVRSSFLYTTFLSNDKMKINK